MTRLAIVVASPRESASSDVVARVEHDMRG